MRRSSGEWISYALTGGASPSSAAIWRSPDGFRWFPDPEPVIANTEATRVVDRRVGPGKGSIIEIDGRLWSATNITTPVSGAASTASTVVAGPLSDDARTFSGPPSLAWVPQLAGESNDVQSFNATVDQDGAIVATVVCGADMYLATGTLV